jgi:radical SAM superfamily enzyme YgiQ (UPF0313 family)
MPPIALGIIAALTPDDWDVEIVDENVEELVIKKYDLVGITTNMLNIRRTYDIATAFRNISTPVILGGWHSSAVPEESIQYADSVVIGNVEPLWPLIIKDFNNGELKQEYFSIDQNFNFISPLVTHFENKYFLDAIESSRGCHNYCSFCGAHVPRHNQYKRKSIEMIISELKQSKNPLVFFVDNNFYGNDDNFLFALFNEMIKQKINKKWMSQFSVNFFKNEELVSLASKAGATLFYVGLEVNTKNALSFLGKENQGGTEDVFSEYQKIIKLCHKNKILVSSIAMIGLEDDNEAVINARIRFFTKLKIDNCRCAILTPLPKTKIYEKLLNENRLLFLNFPDDWKDYLYCNNVFVHKNISSEKMIEMAEKANKVFQQNAFRVLKSFFITRSINSLRLYYYQCNHLANYRNKNLDYLFRKISSAIRFFKS